MAAKGTTGYFLAGSSGLLLASAFPPCGFSLAAWFALVPLLLAVTSRSGRPFLRGLLAGVVFRALTMYWIVPMLHGYAQASWAVSLGAFTLLALYLSAYTGLFTWVLSWFIDRWGERGLLGAPFLWSASEYANQHLLTGFHWLPLAASQSSHLAIIQVAEFSGTAGAAFLVASFNAALTFVALMLLPPAGNHRPTRRMALGAVAAAGALVLGAWGWGSWRIEVLERQASEGKSFRVRLVNPAVPQTTKWSAAFRTEAIKQLSALSKPGAGQVDLILWPEAAAPFYFGKDPVLSAEIHRLSSDLSTPILFGAPGQAVGKSGVTFLNSAFLVGPGEELLGRYDKRKLVPFGEYVPLGELLSFVPPVARGLAYAGLTPGGVADPFSLGDRRFGVLICYEAIFRGLVRSSGEKRVDFLVNLTNDAWLSAPGAAQHFAMARFAPIEARLPLVRVANGGTSAVFGPSGRIRCAMGPSPPGARECTLTFGSGSLSRVNQPG